MRGEGENWCRDEAVVRALSPANVDRARFPDSASYVG